jgi:hypothetical protein
VITADAGYHSEANLRQLATPPGQALMADNDMRRRDERFATQPAHKTAPDPLHDKSPAAETDPGDPPGVFARARSPITQVLEPACARLGTRSIATANIA